MKAAAVGLVVFTYIFGHPIFAEHVIHDRGLATSLSGAKEVCEEQNKNLITAENDEMKKSITTFLAKNVQDAAWLFTNFRTLRNWTFGDASQTILNDGKIDVTEGGFCGALSTVGTLPFKSLPCNKGLPAIKNSAGKHQLYNGTKSYKWHDLDKTSLATPYNKTTRFAEVRQTATNLDFGGEFWINLRRFQFTWPDGTEISLQQWEDKSEDSGDCLILKKNGKMVIVDCEGRSSNHSVLCFEEGPMAASWTTVSVLGTVLGTVLGLLLIAALFVAYRRYKPKCCAKSKPEYNEMEQQPTY